MIALLTLGSKDIYMYIYNNPQELLRRALTCWGLELDYYYCYCCRWIVNYSTIGKNVQYTIVSICNQQIRQNGKDVPTMQLYTKE